MVTLGYHVPIKPRPVIFKLVQEFYSSNRFCYLGWFTTNSGDEKDGGVAVSKKTLASEDVWYFSVQPSSKATPYQDYGKHNVFSTNLTGDQHLHITPDNI